MARIAGFTPTEFQSEDTDNLWIHVGSSGVSDWNPLIHGDQALQLAIRLRLIVTFTADDHVGAGQRCGPFSFERLPATGCGSPAECSATRRAIVRAAASLAKDAGGAEV